MVPGFVFDAGQLKRPATLCALVTRATVSKTHRINARVAKLKRQVPPAVYHLVFAKLEEWSLD
jgi:hypothetical protein